MLDRHEVEHIRISWGDTTNPTKHNPENFRYLVHAFNPLAKLNKLQLSAIIGEQIDIDKESGDQTVNLQEHPELVAERVSLSMSLIDQDHLGTWGDTGLIVDVPEENILITSNSDVGSINHSLAELKRQSSKDTLLSANDLLARSTDSYNEVVALANIDGEEIRLAGFFYKAEPNGQPINQLESDRLMSHATQLNLPMVPIYEKGKYSVNEIKEDKQRDMLAVHLDGTRYLLRFDGVEMYRSIDGYSGGSCLVTPLEMDKIANYLRDNGFEEDLISKLFDNYKKTDEEYHDTNIKRDKDGHIIGLSKTIGYRDEEVKVFVNNSGYSHVVATKKLQQAMTDVMQNIDRSSLGRDIYNVKADIQTVQLMINEAAKKLSEKEASLFLKEFADIAQKMSTQHRYD